MQDTSPAVHVLSILREEILTVINEEVPMYKSNCACKSDLDRLLMDQDDQLEIGYLGSGFKLDVFRVYKRETDLEIGQLRCYGSGKWHLLRFDLPETVESPSPLRVPEDEDGDSWSVPGWDSINGFLDSFERYPANEESCWHVQD